MGIVLSISAELYETLRVHLFSGDVEQLAFLLAKPKGNVHDLQLIEVYPIPSDAFEIQSELHISLLPDVRAQVIKWAWDRGGSLVEAHSHRGPVAAAFSPSDMEGFDEFVPHVWWRLQGRPYAALVFSEEGFDGLVWISGPSSPEGIEALRVEGRGDERPTGLTQRRLRWRIDDR